MPLISGRRTSHMRQSTFRGCFPGRNSSTEANALTSRLMVRISLSGDPRTEMASSTTATSFVIEVSTVVDNRVTRKMY